VLENKKNQQLEHDEDLEEDHDDQEEDEEMEQILDDMDDCEEQMKSAVYSTEYTANDYAAEKELECEKLKKTVEKMRWDINDLEESRFQARADSAYFENMKEEYFIQCYKNSQDIQQYKYEIEYYQEENSKLLQERMELTSELAHFKELLAQYEPDVKKQNKDLYH
jgi:hypothetical protein